MARPDGPEGRLRSRIAVEGLDRTPHRTFLRAMGGEITPCSMSLAPQADAANPGVAPAE
jgi:dihydroxy-acid dehydratase